MKPFLLLILLPFLIKTSLKANVIRYGDSLKVKQLNKKDFITRFGVNDSVNALINLFFAKNRDARAQTIIGSALLIVGTIAWATPHESNDDQKGFGDLIRPVVEPGAIALGAILTTAGIIKFGKYTKEKLYTILSDYENGIPIPDKYRKCLKKKYFLQRRTITPQF